VASSAAVSAFSSDSEDSSSDEDDCDEGVNPCSSDVSRRGSYTQPEIADNKDDSIEMRKAATSNLTRRCFNFDLNGQQKSMIQRMKEKDKGKKKKNKGGVRFLTEGEFPPEFAPTDNVMPFDSCISTPRSRADSVCEMGSRSGSGSDGDGVGDMWKEHRGMSSVSVSIADSRRSSSSTLNDSAGGRLGILEAVGTAILTLFSSRTPSTASTPTTTSTSSSTATSTFTPPTYKHGHI
jgi:hypothetical protein